MRQLCSLSIRDCSKYFFVQDESLQSLNHHRVINYSSGLIFLLLEFLVHSKVDPILLLRAALLTRRFFWVWCCHRLWLLCSEITRSIIIVCTPSQISLTLCWCWPPDGVLPHTALSVCPCPLPSAAHCLRVWAPRPEEVLSQIVKTDPIPNIFVFWEMFLEVRKNVRIPNFIIIIIMVYYYRSDRD